MSSLRLTRQRPVEASAIPVAQRDRAVEDASPDVSDQRDVSSETTETTVDKSTGVDIPQPLLHCEVMVQSWTISAASGRSARFRVMDSVISEGVHPLKGVRCAQGRNGMAQAQRLRIVITKPDGDRTSSLYQGEGLLQTWSDDSRQGMRFSLRFDGGPEGVDWHPLSGVEADGSAGEVVVLTTWAISDDELLQDAQSTPRRGRPFHQMPPVRQSQIKCRMDNVFQQWCRLVAANLLPPDEIPEASLSPVVFAEQFVRAFCQVESRSEMSHDTANGFAARERWREIMRMYDDYRRH